MPKFGEVEWGKGECWDTHTDLFYQVEEERSTTAYKYINAVRSICGRCPIQMDCLAYAFGHEEFGVWGGLTSLERLAVVDPAKYPSQLQRAMESLKMYGITIQEVRKAYEHSIDGGSLAHRSRHGRKDGSSGHR